MTTITLSDKSKSITELHNAISDLTIKASEISKKQVDVFEKFKIDMEQLSNMHNDILEKMIAAEVAIEKIMRA